MPERRNPMNRADLALPPGHSPGVTCARAHRGTGHGCSCRDRVAGNAARGRVYAEPRRGHAILYAGHPAGLSVAKSAKLLQTYNKIKKSFPEVTSVFGQGRPRRHRDGPRSTAPDVPRRAVPSRAPISMALSWRVPSSGCGPR